MVGKTGDLLFEVKICDEDRKLRETLIKFSLSTASIDKVRAA